MTGLMEEAVFQIVWEGNVSGPCYNKCKGSAPAAGFIFPETADVFSVGLNPST